jgi:hypothetical protein
VNRVETRRGGTRKSIRACGFEGCGRCKHHTVSAVEACKRLAFKDMHKPSNVVMAIRYLIIEYLVSSTALTNKFP